MTEQIVPPVPPSEKRGFAGKTGVVVETVGIEPTQGSRRELPAVEPRTRSNCTCGGPCFYCGRALSKGRHEHDHFPIPFRHGGTATVPTCLECHHLKDRRATPGVSRDGSIDEPVARAIERGMVDLPMVHVASTGECLPMATWLVVEMMLDWSSRGHVDWDGGDWLVDDVEWLAERTVKSIELCTTPEAKVFLGRIFTSFLDLVNDALTNDQPIPFVLPRREQDVRMAA